MQGTIPKYHVLTVRSGIIIILPLKPAIFIHEDIFFTFIVFHQYILNIRMKFWTISSIFISYFVASSSHPQNSTVFSSTFIALILLNSRKTSSWRMGNLIRLPHFFLKYYFFFLLLIISSCGFEVVISVAYKSLQAVGYRETDWVKNLILITRVLWRKKILYTHEFTLISLLIYRS